MNAAPVVQDYQYQKENQAESRSNAIKKKKIARHRAYLKWWVGTVILTLFPTLSTVLVTILQGKGPITLEMIFNDGEIVLSSFLIVVSTAIMGHPIKNQTVKTDIVRYILFFLGAAQLIGYTTIKTNEQNDPKIVIVFSLAALFLSVCISWIWYKWSNKEVL